MAIASPNAEDSSRERDVSPTFSTFGEDDVYTATFAVRLNGLGTRPSRASSPEEAEQWGRWQDTWRRRWVAGLLAPDAQAEFELRYIGGRTFGDQKLLIALVGKVRAQDRPNALKKAAEMYADLEAVVRTNPLTYEFVPVADEAELAQVLEPFAVRHLVELRRSGTPFCESHRPGFETATKSRRQAAVVPPALPVTDADRHFLCQLVGDASLPLMLCAKLAVTTVSLPRMDDLDVVRETGALAPEIYGPVLTRLADLGSQKDQLCALRLFVAGAAPVPGSVTRMLGCELLTDDANAWETIDLEPAGLGGSPSTLDLAAAPQPRADLAHVYTREEAASVFRLPLPSSEDAYGIRRRHGYVPPNLPEVGAILGFKTASGGKRNIRLAETDKGKHVYVLGQTGTGKSTLLQSMAMSDIRDGRGLCVIDPHGDLLAKILARIPDDRRDDVVLFDPTDVDYPMGMNLLDARDERHRSFLANELVLILRRLYDPKFTGIIGPQFEQAVRDAALTAMSLPEGGTVLDIPKLLSDRDFARSKLQYVDDAGILSFWNDVWFKKADFHLSEIMGYITSKFDSVSSDPMMRRIVGQSRNALDFRALMDEGRVVLVNLSKGGVGEANSALLGSILVARLFSAALTRQDMPAKDRRPFTLYLDEFHNFTTDSIQSMLSEARKYRLALVLAHQNLQQLPPELLQAVLGNVGSTIFFRPGPSDVKMVAEYVRPHLSERDLLDLPNWTAAGRLLIDGMPSKPFVFQVARDGGEADYAVSDYIRERMHRMFGRHRDLVDADISRRLTIDQ